MNKIVKIIISFPIVYFLAFALQVKAVEPNEVLALAEKSGNWIASTAVQQKIGIAWPDDALNPERISYDLATGVSGKVVYFVGLYRASGKKEYLNHAIQGTEYLISLIDSPTTFETNKRKSSLYSGISGIGVAIMHVVEEVPDQKYHNALNKIISMLQQWSHVELNKRHWSAQFNDLIYGDTGTVLFLSHYSKKFNNPLAKQMSHQGALFLLSIAKKSNDGLYWLFRRDKDYNLPNFSHGTAGVVYVLSTVAVQSNDASLLKGAKLGFQYLRSIAEINNNRIRMPYGWGSDSWKGLYEFGWAHGLTGVSLTLERLEQDGIESEYAEKYLMLIRNTLVDINLQGKPKEPFAEASIQQDKRFGRAGVLSLLSYWRTKYPNDLEVIALRDALWQQMNKLAIQDKQYSHWKVDAPLFMGGNKAAYTGLFHGTAGIGIALLDMYASMKETSTFTNLPDVPF